MSKKPNNETIFNTTFGVEIEMTGITRRRAAEVCAEVMGEGSTVRDTRLTDGYNCWSCFDPSGRKWKFVSDGSICVTGGHETSVELNTPPLTYTADMDKLQELVRALRGAGAVSGVQYGCGIHVHVSGKGHTPQSIINLTNLFFSNDELIRKSLGVASSRQRWCAPIPERLAKSFIEKRDELEHEHKRLTFEKLADVWYDLLAPHESRHEHYNHSRYHILNLHRFFSTLGEPSNTVEVRAFNASLHAGEIRAYVLLVLSMNASALTQKYIRALKNPVMLAGNEKYAMRTWLNRMGWTGEMFKNPHKLFIERLNGDCANRFGRYNDQYGANNDDNETPLF